MKTSLTSLISLHKTDFSLLKMFPQHYLIFNETSSASRRIPPQFTLNMWFTLTLYLPMNLGEESGEIAATGHGPFNSLTPFCDLQGGQPPSLSLPHLEGSAPGGGGYCRCKFHRVGWVWFSVQYSTGPKVGQRLVGLCRYNPRARLADRFWSTVDPRAYAVWHVA